MRILVKATLLFVITLSAFLQIWILFGHYYRYPFKEQFKTWYDGVNEEKVSSNYPFDRDKNLDTFDPEYYEKVRSVKDAVDFIRTKYKPGNELETAKAVYDFVAKRFIHYFYPHHTLITNPYFYYLEKRVPENSLDEMATADELLRHSAAGACGDASVTFIEIYRAFGYKAQYVSLNGHHVAEALIGGRKYLVDSDMEVMAPYSISEINKNNGLIDEIYSKKSESSRESLKRIFGKPYHESGFDGVPHPDRAMYLLHERIEKQKWFVFSTIFALSLLIFVALKKIRYF